MKSLLAAEGYEGFECAVSIAHLENRVAAAMMLGARDEFRLYLMMYAKRLGAEGMKGKIEELLRSLMGSMFEDEDGDDETDPSDLNVDGIHNNNESKTPKRKAQGQGWMSEGDEIVGWKRDDLLKEVVLLLGQYPPHTFITDLMVGSC